MAQALYDNVDDGTPVIIYYSEAYEVSEDTLTVTQAPEADDENVNDTTNTTTVTPTRTPSYTYDDDDDSVNAVNSINSINSIDPVYAGTDRSTDRDPVYAGADRSTDGDPSTPEPTQEPSAPDQGDHTGDDDYPGKGES